MLHTDVPVCEVVEVGTDVVLLMEEVVGVVLSAVMTKSEVVDVVVVGAEDVDVVSAKQRPFVHDPMLMSAVVHDRPSAKLRPAKHMPW